MLQLVYASLARQPVDGVLLGIVGSAERNNERMGISGMLVYENQTYLQFFEGPPRAVLQLYATVGEDPRHRICSAWRRIVERRVLSESLPMGYMRAEFPPSYLFALDQVSGPRAVEFALHQARLKYPRSSGLELPDPDERRPFGDRPGGEHTGRSRFN